MMSESELLELKEQIKREILKEMKEIVEKIMNIMKEKAGVYNEML